MGLFDFINRLFGGGSSGGYPRIVGWVKQKHNPRFRDGMSEGEVRMQLETILNEELSRGVPEKTLAGFKAYIEVQNYDGLIKGPE
jgi:hypothetical protein